MKMSPSALITCVTSILLGTSAGQASVIRHIDLDPQHQTLGQSYLLGGSSLTSSGGAAVAFRAVNTLTGASGFLGSGVLVNPYWVLTAWHVADNDLLSNIDLTVRTGPNYLTSPGSEVNVAQVLSFPDAPLFPGPGPDIGLVRLSEPVFGVQPVVFGSAVPGEIVTSSGFGLWGVGLGLPNPGTPLAFDGNVRGWRSQVASDNIHDEFASPYYHGETDTDHFFPVAPLDGRAQPGDSGSPVWNSQGALVGINAYGTADNFMGGRTGYVRLDRPEVLDWITTTIAIPSPGTVVVPVVGVLLALKRRRSLPLHQHV